MCTSCVCPSNHIVDRAIRIHLTTDFDKSADVGHNAIMHDKLAEYYTAQLSIS